MQYNDLLTKLQESQCNSDELGFPVIFKNLPDENAKGNSFDKRVYKNMHFYSFILKMIPKRIIKVNKRTIKKVKKFVIDKKYSRNIEGEINIQNIYFKNDGYDIPIRVYMPIEKKNSLLPIIYYIHGGCFFGGNTEILDDVCKLFVLKMPCIVFSIEYRLVPKFKYMDSYDDVYKGLNFVYEKARDFGGDNSKMWVAGDSAGGNFAIYCTNKAIEENKKIIKGNILYYPTVNMCGHEDKYFSKDKIYFEYDKKTEKIIKAFNKVFDDSEQKLKDILKVESLDTPILSPYIVEYKEYPPTLLMFGEFDFLTNENIAFAHKLFDSGTKLRTIIYRGMWHGFINYVGKYPQADDSIFEAIKFIKNL